MRFAISLDSLLAMQLQLSTHWYVSLAQLLVVAAEEQRENTAEMGGSSIVRWGCLSELRRPSAAGAAGFGVDRAPFQAHRAIELRRRDLRRRRKGGVTLLQAIRL